MLDKLANQQFVSAKMQQNTLFSHLLESAENEYLGTIMPKGKKKLKAH